MMLLCQMLLIFSTQKYEIFGHLLFPISYFLNPPVPAMTLCWEIISKPINSFQTSKFDSRMRSVLNFKYSCENMKKLPNLRATVTVCESVSFFNHNAWPAYRNIFSTIYPKYIQKKLCHLFAGLTLITEAMTTVFEVLLTTPTLAVLV